MACFEPVGRSLAFCLHNAREGLMMEGQQQQQQQRPDVPGYEIESEIGRGGFAAVFRARQISVGRSVALKVIFANLVEPEVERRFRAECETVGGLSWHPHVVALHDAGVTPDGSPFLAMELLTGGSLGDLIRDGNPLPSDDVARFGAQVGDALSAAHDAHVLHRDIKPDNILIGRRGEALLGDFGIATLADGTRSATGSFTGTLAYSAPELLRGERAWVRSEVFALGATLYSLLLGRHAFASGDDLTPAAIIYRVLNGEPDTLPESTPRELAAALERSIHKDPAARQRDIAELVTELTGGATGSTSSPPNAIGGASSALVTIPSAEIVTRSDASRPATADQAAGATTNRSPASPTPENNPLKRRRSLALIACIVGVVAAVGIALLVQGRNDPAVSASTTTEATPSTSQTDTTPSSIQPGVTAERKSPDIILFENAIDALTPFHGDLTQLTGDEITQPENEAALIGAWYALADWCTANGHGRVGVCYDRAAVFLLEYFDRDPRTINMSTWGRPGAIGGVIADAYDLTNDYLGVDTAVMIPDLFTPTRPGDATLCEPSCTAVLDEDPNQATTAPPATTPTPGQPCALGTDPDCIDPDQDGEGVYLVGGASCIESFPDSPGLCSDNDGDGAAGYPDSG